MLWLADECVAAPLVAQLRDAGHDVLYVAELAAGLDDHQVIALAEAQGSLLLTDDKDFGDLVFRHRHSVPGIVSMRIVSETPVFDSIA
jgi:predicted nuclease of predicted toxin-antitoxin system